MAADTFRIDSLDALRQLYPSPKERALKKQLDALDRHCRRFISLSPFLVVATTGEDGLPDASPRGGAPGFVQVPDARTLLIPDSLGNNRLDTLANIVASGRVGLLFLIPGVDETLRVNGAAYLSVEPALLDRFSAQSQRPRTVLVVSVSEAYLHCAKALMRARVWHGDSRVDRSALPTMGEMIKDQIGSEEPAESQAAMLARYAGDL